MARVVILSFADNKAAEAFLKNLIDAQENPETGENKVVQLGSLGLLIASYGTIEALLARPTQFCTCPGSHKGEYGKTEHPGWYVHKTCGKPEKVLVERYIDNLTISGGNNLLLALREKRQRNVHPNVSVQRVQEAHDDGTSEAG